VVVTGNVADVAPSGTVTLVGTKAGEPFVHRLTTRPPAGAAVFKVTVPVVETPPSTVFGATETALKAAVGATVSVAVMLAPL
jgi:hypothetical protein